MAHGGESGRVICDFTYHHYYSDVLGGDLWRVKEERSKWSCEFYFILYSGRARSYLENPSSSGSRRRDEETKPVTKQRPKPLQI